MTREQLIQELEKGLEQLKSIRPQEDQLVLHQVDLGGYTCGYKEIEDFTLNFTQEEDGEIIIDYIVEEV